MDIVFIRQLRVDTVIGVYEWERSIKQTLILDLELASDNRRAAANDTIADAVDYAAIAARTLLFVERSRFRLLESLAEELVALIMLEFDIPWVRLRISKPGAVVEASDVGVLIERGEQP